MPQSGFVMKSNFVDLKGSVGERGWGGGGGGGGEGQTEKERETERQRQR